MLLKVKEILKKQDIKIIALFVLLAITFTLSFYLGKYPISPGELFSILFSNGLEKLSFIFGDEIIGSLINPFQYSMGSND